MKSNWIPCSERLPEGTTEIACLVTCQEWDVFKGNWGNSVIRILSYIPKNKTWNTKSMVKVIAWMPLPEPYDEE